MATRPARRYERSKNTVRTGRRPERRLENVSLTVCPITRSGEKLVDFDMERDSGVQHKQQETGFITVQELMKRYTILAYHSTYSCFLMISKLEKSCIKVFFNQ